MSSLKTLVVSGASVVSAVVGILSLTHNIFGGARWFGISVGAMMVIGGAIMSYSQVKNSSPSLVFAVSSSALVVIGAALAATLIFLPAGTPAVRTVSAGEGRLSILFPGDDEVVQGRTRISGRIEETLPPGDSVWFFIGNVPPSGGNSSVFYLQDGPCPVTDNGRTWYCDWAPAMNNPRQVRIYVVQARRTVPLTLVSSLIHGAMRDQINSGADNPGEDPRNYQRIPEGPDLQVMDEVTVGIRP
ncbi:hypothetical protein V5P93_003807 [Actinokineospora auranticolor]|nr:hypothetical protein [Actinokineospora auranticolor]